MHTHLLIMVALSACGLIYFIFLRRVFDFVSVGFVGQLIYFSPGFYGYVSNPYYPGILPAVPIIDETFLVWNMCLAATLVTGLVYRPAQRDIEPIATTRAFDIALIAILFAAGIGTLSSGFGVLSADKNEVLDSVNRFFLLFASCSQVGLIAFALQRKWLLLLFPTLGMLFLLYAGFRGEFAISVIAIGAYLAHRFGIFVFLRPKNLVLGLVALAILLGYKPFLTAYRIGNWQVLSQLQMSDNLVETLTLQFEPFLTQAVLNEALLRHFEVPASSIYFSFVALVPFLGPAIGMRPEDVAFNFQDYLFPNISYGITAGPQTQLLAAMGFGGLAGFIIALNLLLVASSKALASPHVQIRLFALAVGAFLAFYIQRNDLANSFTLINRMALSIGICWLGGWLFTAGSGRVSVPPPVVEPRMGRQ